MTSKDHSPTTAFQKQEPIDVRGQICEHRYADSLPQDRRDISEIPHGQESASPASEEDSNDIVQAINVTPDKINEHITNLKEVIAILESEVDAYKQNHDTDAFRRQQNHYLALHAKLEELKKSKSEIERQRELLSQKEYVIFQQNQDLCQYETLRRDYDASLTRVAKLETENGILREDRDKHVALSQEYEGQAAVLTQEKDGLRNRLDAAHHSLVVLQTQHTEQIQNLERLLDEVRQQRDEAQQERDEVRYERDEIRQERDDAGQRLSRARIIILRSNMQLLKRGRSTTSLTRTQSAETTESGVADVNLDSSAAQSDRRNSEPNRKKFIVEPVSASTCRNCRAIVDVGRATHTKCCFHRAEPQPYQVWKNTSDSDKARDPVYREHRYWPCCDKLARKEPAGCLVLHRHELVDPDLRTPDCYGLTD